MRIRSCKLHLSACTAPGYGLVRSGVNPLARIRRHHPHVSEALFKQFKWRVSGQATFTPRAPDVERVRDETYVSVTCISLDLIWQVVEEAAEA